MVRATLTFTMVVTAIASLLLAVASAKVRLTDTVTGFLTRRNRVQYP